MLAVHVSKRESLDERCAVCHDGIAAARDVGACERCASRWHVGCRHDLGRCPTLGCDTPLVVRARVPTEERVARSPRLFAALAGSILTVVLMTAGTWTFGWPAFVALGLVHFLAAPLYWALRVRGEWSADVVRRVFLALVLVQGVGAFLAWFAMVVLASIAVVTFTAAGGESWGGLSAWLTLGCVGWGSATFGPPLAAWFVGREPWQTATRA